MSGTNIHEPISSGPMMRRWWLIEFFSRRMFMGVREPRTATRVQEKPFDHRPGSAKGFYCYGRLCPGRFTAEEPSRVVRSEVTVYGFFPGHEVVIGPRPINAGHFPIL